MPALALKAHFDGKQILLDEPYALTTSARLVVLVMPEAGQEDSLEQLEIGCSKPEPCIRRRRAGIFAERCAGVAVKEGMVALASLPQSDGMTKLPLVLLLKQMPGYGDWLVCGVSRQLWQEIAGFDEIISESTADFSTSGLKSASVIRLGFLSSLPVTAISCVIDWVAAERQQQLLIRLTTFLQTGINR